jgi:Terpene cyclase DEP1
MQRALLVVTLVLFGILSAFALAERGYLGIFALHFQSYAGAQVLADLVIALTLVMIWMWRDARSNGRRIWPWLLATLALGSFGPLLYLLTRPESKGAGRAQG